MRLDLAAAGTLAMRSLEGLGLSPVEAEAVSAHLIDCELRGLGFAGLARIVSIAERLAKRPGPPSPIAMLHETPVSARLDGGDNLGYLVAERATDIAIDKALAAGVGVVGASATWYTGMLSFYAEKATAKDLVVMIASNATPWVAPYGGTEARFGTNPICYGFPSADEPVIWDIGVSNIIHAQVVLAQRLGLPIPEGSAFGPDGRPTTDPRQALEGAFTVWGGHRGGGLALVVQMLGMLAGSPMAPPQLADFGFLIVALRPDLLTPLEDYKREVAAYAAWVRATRPVEGGEPVRMPFDRSRQDRARRLAEGWIEVPDAVVAEVRAIAAG